MGGNGKEDTASNPAGTARCSLRWRLSYLIVMIALLFESEKVLWGYLNLRLLFEIDKKDYDENGERTYRFSSCGIVIRNQTVAMCYVDKHQVYVIPGGGIETEETREQAVIREMHEETGLRIIPESIMEYGMIRSIRKGLHEPVYVLDDYYFLCDAEDPIDEIRLTEKEKMNGYHFGFINVFDVLQEDEKRVSQGEAPCLFKRDRMLLEKLISEGYFHETR